MDSLLAPQVRLEPFVHGIPCVNPCCRCQNVDRSALRLRRDVPAGSGRRGSHSAGDPPRTFGPVQIQKALVNHNSPDALSLDNATPSSSRPPILGGLPSIAALEAPAAPAERLREPTDDDWARMKPIIADLYRRHSLLQVIEIMKRSHAFKAR